MTRTVLAIAACLLVCSRGAATQVLEARDPELEGIGRIVSGMSHLAGVLGGRHYSGLKLVTEYHPGMGHSDVMGATVVRGLRTLYQEQ